MLKIITRLTLASAAVAAAMFFQVPASFAAYGDAPWCAVVNTGTGTMQWECEYYSAAECAPHVVAGNRGFCNVNPRWRGGYDDGGWHHHYRRHHRHWR